MLIEETLAKQNMSFLVKDDELLEKYNEIRKTLKIISKKKLKVSLCTMKNI